MSGFTEEDYNKLVEFMNFIHTKMKMENATPADMMKYAGLYQIVGSKILPKIKEHQMEVSRVIEPKKKENKAKE